MKKDEGFICFNVSFGYNKTIITRMNKSTKDKIKERRGTI